MLLVPIQPVPSQTFQVNLASQVCQLNLYQKPQGLFMDVFFVGQEDPVIAGVLCENLNRIVRSAYLGFTGDFIFNDTKGVANPYFEGLGTQFQLLYLTAADLEEFGFTG